jgi:hypothetical protein
MSAFVVVIGCCIWIPLAVWILSLVGWMVTADIDILTGVLGIWIAIGLGYVAMKPPVPALSPLSFIAVLITLVMYPWARSALNRRELKSIDVEALEKAYEQLAMKPDNTLARFKVAKHAYILGMPGHALKIAEEALAYIPERHFQDEHRLLKRWRAQVQQPEFFRAIQCVECNAMNPPGRIHCTQCGAPFLLDRARGKVLGKGQGRKIVAAWFAMVAVLAGIPAATALPPMLTIVTIVALLVAACCVVFLAFRDSVAA